MRKSTIVMAVLATALVCGVGMSAWQGQAERDDAAVAVPQVLSVDDVPQAWRAATAAIDEPLPAGVHFPADPPPFFDPNLPGTPDAFVPKLPQQIAARWWRCAWIASALDADPEQRVAATRRAQSTVDAWYEMAGVKGDSTFSDYDSRMRTAASAAGESRFEVEFELDCGRLVFEDKGHS